MLSDDDRAMLDNMNAAQYTAAIGSALKQGDVQAVHDVLALMATRHPREAGEVLKQLRVGLAIARLR